MSGNAAITFAQARAVVEADAEVRNFFGDRFVVADFGWENDAVFMMSVDAADGVAIFDAPVILVDKATGTVIQKAGLLGRRPAPGLRPIS